MLCLGAMSHTINMKQAFLNKFAQSCLKSVCATVVKAQKVLVAICCVPQLWKWDARNLKDYHIRQSSNVKLFGVQRRETGKPLQFAELMKATFDCGGNTRQQSVSVRCHKRNSMDPSKDNFLKMMMQSSCFFQQTQDWNKLYCIFLTAHIAALSFFQNPAHDCEFNPHVILIHI
jgi:hypothetical protein